MEGSSEVPSSCWACDYTESPAFADPDAGEGHEYDWCSRATFTAENIGAPGGQFVASMGQMGRWVYDRLTRFADPPYTVVDTLYASDSTNAGIPEQTRAALEEGRSFAASRGWLMGCMSDDDPPIPTNTGRKHPFVAAITCLSHTRQINFFNSGSVNRPSGSIASLAMFGLTNTRTNQCLMGWIVRGMVYQEMHQPGWIQLFSKLQLVNDYLYDRNTLQALVPQTLHVYRLLGDPNAPWEITAERLAYDQEEGVYRARGAVVIRKGDQVLHAEEATYRQKTGMVSVRGNVRLEAGGDVLRGDSGWFDLNRQVGRIEGGRLFLARNHYYVRGDLVEKTGPDTYRVRNCVVTTCDGDKYIDTIVERKSLADLYSTLIIDNNRERLYREIDRFNADERFDKMVIIVEGSYTDFMLYVPEFTAGKFDYKKRFNSKKNDSINEKKLTVLADLFVKGVPVMFCDTPTMAAQFCGRLFKESVRKNYAKIIGGQEC